MTHITCNWTSFYIPRACTSGLESSVYLFRRTLIIFHPACCPLSKQIKVLYIASLSLQLATVFHVCPYSRVFTFHRHFQHITVASSSLSATTTATNMTTRAVAVISWLTAALLISCTVVRPTLSCRISEFMCKSTGGCVQLDEYCDGKYDCPDRSDEPPSCTGMYTTTRGYNIIYTDARP